MKKYRFYLLEFEKAGDELVREISLEPMTLAVARSIFHASDKELFIDPAEVGESHEKSLSNFTEQKLDFDNFEYTFEQFSDDDK